ncbi:ankyrin repeat protein [Pleomassaria siparia CBS 279.74]|uniref:Ankyrin repeat protein n=1 Tax=Pleomassaria siparia CBS 279.74 TaxID=1314801 RepID=A0A6G1KNW8_9PLEO|nr:ankyrin repeat protein [Pleomassaria siparia CBS 279.74]
MKESCLNCLDQKGRTPLHYSATVDNKSSIELLIKHGAAIDQSDQVGRTALDDALRSGEFDAVMILPKHAADVTRLDNFLQSRLHLAARYGHELLSKLILDKGLQMDVVDVSGMTDCTASCL